MMCNCHRFASFVMLVLFVGFAVSADAGPPVPGTFKSELGQMLPGRRSVSSQLAGDFYAPGNVVNSASWGGNALGAEWRVECASLINTTLIFDNTIGGTGQRGYVLQYAGGTFQLDGAAAWGGGDASYAGVIDNYTEVVQEFLVGGVRVSASANISWFGHLNGYSSSCVSWAGNAVLVSSSSPGATGCAVANSGSLLFPELLTTPAPAIPPGPQYVYASNAYEVTRLPGERLYVSGSSASLAPLVYDDDLNVAGQSVGGGPYTVLDPSLPIGVPIETVLQPIPAQEILQSMIPVGTHCVNFELVDTQRAIYGNTPIYLVKVQSSPDYPVLLDLNCNATRMFGSWWDLTNLTLTIQGCAVSTVLTSFTAERHEAGVMLKWALFDDALRADAFQVYRGEGTQPNERVSFDPLSGQSRYEFLDRDAPHASVHYWLEETTPMGEIRWHGPVEAPLSREGAYVLTINPNFPNPFNPVTVLEYVVSGADRVQLDIYNVSGRLVRRLLDGQLTPGVHQTTWDGRDDTGRVVSSGVFVVRLQTGGVVASRKIVMLK